MKQNTDESVIENSASSWSRLPPPAGSLNQPAPTNNLPDWNECNLRVKNEEYIKKEKLNIYDFDEPYNMPNELHRFIYEYDDSDPFKSAWFLHRLERLINEIKENPEQF
jgi:hypothetical protein